jgi:hypothetical protein
MKSFQNFPSMGQDLSELTFDLSGTYELMTASGSKYVVDLDAKTLSRDTGMPDSDESASNPLRRDSETVRLIDFIGVAVGRLGRFLIDLEVDGVAATHRQTTIIRKIVKTSVV